MVRVEQESYDYRYSMEIVPNIQAQFQIAGNNISHQVNNKPTDQSNVQWPIFLQEDSQKILCGKNYNFHTI